MFQVVFGYLQTLFQILFFSSSACSATVAVLEKKYMLLKDSSNE